MKLENDSKWLFKYMPFNFNAVKLLTNNELWFGKPNTQNDPNEAEFIIKYNEKVNEIIDYRIIIQDGLDSIINKTNSGKTLNDSERIDFEKQLKNIIRDYLGICSMSIKCNDILMWAHYADNNKGICIVFDKDIITNNLGLDADKVSYSESITKANFNKVGNTGQLILDKIFFMDKLDNWNSEGEFRFVKRYNDRIPQNKIDRLKSFSENAIVGIILGENFPVENFKTLINLVYLRNTEKKFYFWKCTKNLYKQSMNIVPISDKHINFYSSQEDYPLEHILCYTKSSFTKNK